MIEHCWLRRNAPCRTRSFRGLGEDMSKHPRGLACPPQPMGTWRRPAQRVPPAQQGKGASKEALTGFPNQYPRTSDRALKAAPTGGLRPALTALPVLGTRPGPNQRARESVGPTPPAAKHQPIELLSEEHPVDTTHCFRYAVPERSCGGRCRHSGGSPRGLAWPYWPRVFSFAGPVRKRLVRGYGRTVLR